MQQSEAMSSNIRINRICQFCNEEFVAKTTVTKYCGDNCAKKAYKQRMRLKKLEKSDEDTLTKINIPGQCFKQAVPLKC